VPRVLAAILENGWDEGRGVVVVPEVLRRWMGGLEVLGREGARCIPASNADI
jgi:seryl-tRNA synthetase